MQPLIRRLVALTSTVVVAPLVAVTLPVASVQAAPDQTTFKATIRVTEHGIPHITAANWPSLGFGSGYAAAEASICTLSDTLLTGRGQRSAYLGPGTYDDQVNLQASNLQVDALVTDLRNRRVVEKLMKDPKAGPGKQARQLVRGYAAGVNAWVKDQGGAAGVTDPLCKGASYLSVKASALDVWYGVYLANLLGSTGVFVPQIVDAAPPAPGAPAASRTTVDRDSLLKALGRDPEHQFGSNATAVGADATTTGSGMLLGNPHFPWGGRYRFTQQHLTIPGKYDVAGASLIGSPVVNIGWNKDVAWSHTVSTAFRFTPYEYQSLGGLSYTTEAGPTQLARDVVKVKVLQKDGSFKTVTEDLYRTHEGYVVNDPGSLMPWTGTSFWAIRDANAEQLRTIDSFLNLGKAKNVRDLLRRQDAAGGIPWVNTTAADRQGNVLYADHSVVPNVPDEMAESCLTTSGRLMKSVAGLPGLDGSRAQSTCAWHTDKDSVRPGVFGPSHLPAVVRKDWVTNANDSYWLPNPKSRLEGFASIIGCEKCVRTMRTRMVNGYVMDRLAGKGRLVSPSSLRDSEYANRVKAAEVMRADGALDDVCAETGETDACAVLKKWDGTSNADSVGNHLFEAFVSRLPKGGIWKKPFDAADPLNTPRGLITTDPQVVNAMSDAISAMRDAEVDLDATWGSLQVPGDRGAPPLPLSGGAGDSAGNANALGSRNPSANKDYYRPVTYGSSHIQAVAFLDGGGLDIKTILTYGQSENPRSPFSFDQTELFSAHEWVSFPWTRTQIDRQLLEKLVVRG